ncbi:hypothetical protein BJY22_003628 [Kribbella shirazensis]|uniref:Uncharacterized protein n=1 Tax=Kribbella shirazensis TaxID=1105143 RepID=A0A7X5VAZ8_9ACTN|nr:hypothetical protein [Kribbella shirazensis]
MTETLPLTGERTAPGIWHENYWVSTANPMCYRACLA